jgi:AcrR family transcriptional regulator
MRKIYTSHRENQRERILEAAERLFIRDGIDIVNMGSIADAARLTRVTLYEYFPNKQEVAWAIFQKIVENKNQDAGGEGMSREGNGFQRLERMLMKWIEELETHPEHLRFIVEFNTLYAREGNPARVRNIVEQAKRDGSNPIKQLIHLGITDGSLRADLDPELISATIPNLMNAVSSRFALLGDLIQVEYGQPVMAMYREICRAFLRGIQSTPDQEKPNEETKL